jgi:glycosyltransferase involved in cell wall biosynthesis
LIDIENPDFATSPASPTRARYPYLPESPESSPAVSIITPYFNTDESFLETARAVFNQSFQAWEWIIVDDGSADQTTLDQLAAVAHAEPRIRVIRQSNAGPSAARNNGVRNSTGQFICLLDSDDMIEPTFIETCIWFLESNPEFGFCNSWTVNFGDEEFLWRVGFERGADHLKANSGPPISVVRRVAFDACGGFDESIRLGHEDWDFWLSLANAGYWGYTLPAFLAWYRKRKSGRFHQVMSAGNLNREFEAAMANKYAGLDSRFPAPARRDTAPYEAVNADSSFANPLAKSDDGKRTLFLIPWMVTGGADRVNLDWIDLLIQAGHQVSVCATLDSHHNWISQFARLTPDVFVLPDFLRLADYPRFMVYLIRSRKIDTVLITGSTIGYQLLPYLRANCPGVRFVDLCHVEEPHWLNGGHPRFAVGYQDQLDLNIVTTGALRQSMIERGGNPDRIEVCYSGITSPLIAADSDADRRLVTELGLIPGVPVIVFAGRICEQKRPSVLADILCALTAHKASFQALIIGDGELLPMLSKRVKEHGLGSHVKFLGMVDHDRWLDVLTVADIFLLPSQYEGISVALLEAMAMGLVPVVSNVGGHAEVITVENGFLIDHGISEVDQYVSTLTKLLNDPAALAGISSAARQHVESAFSRTATSVRLQEVLDRANAWAASAPRQALSAGTATEMATLAVEYTRLNRVADVLWSQRLTAPAGSLPESMPTVGGAVKLIMLLSNTRIGRFLLGSSMIHRFGRWLLQRLDKR